MRILFDQGTPAPLRSRLVGHSVVTAHEIGWADLDNGRLLAAAEAEFDALVTTDQNLRFQQNMNGRKLAIFILPTTSWPRVQERIAEVAAAIDSLAPGAFVEIKFADQDSR